MASNLLARIGGAVRRFLNPPRTMMSEEMLFFIDDILVPDPANPGHYTHDSLVEATAYMLECGFDVKPGDAVGGDCEGDVVDERVVAEARERFKRRKK